MRNKFDMQLGLLNEQLIHMGELCELAINRATKALQKGSIEEALNFVLRLKNDTAVVGEVEVSHDFQFKIK